MRQFTFILILTFLTTLSFGQKETTELKLDDKYTLVLTKIPFDKQNHKVRYISKYVFVIDEKPVFGTDGELPRSELVKAELKFDDKIVNLETESMFSPWFGDNLNTKLFKIIPDGTDLKLSGFFSDGAGAYGVEWLIVDNVSIRTIITKDEQILFEYFKY